jgi:hypothetical protein
VRHDLGGLPADVQGAHAQLEAGRHQVDGPGRVPAAVLADAAPLHNVRRVAAERLARVAAQLPVVGVLAGVQRAAQELARRLDGAGLRKQVHFDVAQHRDELGRLARVPAPRQGEYRRRSTPALEA